MTKGHHTHDYSNLHIVANLSGPYPPTCLCFSYSQRATSCPTYLHDYLAWPLLTMCHLMPDLLA